MLTRASKGDGFTSAIQGEPLWGFPVATPTAYARVQVVGATVALGLRRFDDAVDGTFDGAPLTTFDLEKLIRMALHQSVLAFEVLAGLRVKDEGAVAYDANLILENAFTTELVDHLVLSARGEIEQPTTNGWRRAVRQLLQADAARQGIATCEILELVYVADGDWSPLTDPDATFDDVAPMARALLDEVQARKSALPAAPKGYLELNDYLVFQRLTHDD